MINKYHHQQEREVAHSGDPDFNNKKLSEYSKITAVNSERKTAAEKAKPGDSRSRWPRNRLPVA